MGQFPSASTTPNLQKLIFQSLGVEFNYYLAGDIYFCQGIFLPCRKENTSVLFKFQLKLFFYVINGC